jgi:MFS family permease
MYFTLEIIIADSSSLPNRALMFAFATSPFIVNVWTGPQIAQSFFNLYPPAETTLGWRWGNGIWAIILPVLTCPILAILYLNQRKAKRAGAYPEPRWRRKSVWAFLTEMFFELDVIGLVLLTAGFALVLLAITLAGYQSEKWREASIIVMLVIGFCCLVAVCVWEYKFAVYPILRWNLIKDRTVACSCGIGFIFWVTFYCWDGCIPYSDLSHCRLYFISTSGPF